MRQFISRLVTHEAQHVIVAAVQAGGPAEQGSVDDQGTECALVESMPELDALGPELSSFPMEKLRKWIEEGGFIVMARRPATSGLGGKVAGYRLCQRGFFRSNLGHSAPISADFLLIHYAEVLPEYRGQRIAEALQKCSHRFARQRNIACTCGVVSVGNAASLAAHLRPRSGTDPKVIATIHRLSFFGGRFVFRTPLRRIARALESCAPPSTARPTDAV